MISRIKSNHRFYNAPRTYVQSGLAVTPSVMMSLAEDGIPIASSMSDDNFIDGDHTNVVDIDPLLMRGVDVVDAWNLQRRSRNNLVAAKNKDIQNYG